MSHPRPLIGIDPRVLVYAGFAAFLRKCMRRFQVHIVVPGKPADVFQRNGEIHRALAMDLGVQGAMDLMQHIYVVRDEKFSYPAIVRLEDVAPNGVWPDVDAIEIESDVGC